MNTTMQENTAAQIQEVEHLFFATISDQDFLFIKAKNIEATAFVLGKSFLRKLYVECVESKKIAENKNEL